VNTPRLIHPRRVLLLCTALAAVTLPAIALATAHSGKWTAIAPAIDGPNAKHHTKIPFNVSGGAVRNFGVCGTRGACALAGGEACSLAGCFSCRALFEFRGPALEFRGPAHIHGNSFKGVLKLDGGEIIFEGKFTSGSTAHGSWEETGPCPTGKITWHAHQG
jgi:hypothetical protein